MTTNTNTLITATIYVDSQDPDDAGWAYRAEFEDGLQESGSIDEVDADDESGAIVDAARALVEGFGGHWDAGKLTYREQEAGYYVWARA